MRRPTGWLLVALGVAVMVGASIWAPAQPEFMSNGASCEVSQCGLLENPARWRAAWWMWTPGAVATAVGVVTVASMGPVNLSRRASVALMVAATACMPIVLALLVMPAFLVSLGTSTQGAMTVFAVGALLPYLAVVTRGVRALTLRPLTSRSASGAVSTEP